LTLVFPTSRTIRNKSLFSIGISDIFFCISTEQNKLWSNLRYVQNQTFLPSTSQALSAFFLS
jgi:hypothetical protein